MIARSSSTQGADRISRIELSRQLPLRSTIFGGREIQKGQFRCQPFASLRFALLFAVALACFSNQGHTATIAPSSLGPYSTIQAVSAVIRTGDTERPAPIELHDGTGLDNVNPLRAKHSSNLEDAWQHDFDPSEPLSIEFDLGAEFLVNEMWMWQLPDDLLRDQTITQFEIVMRDADGNEVGVFHGDVNELKGVSEAQPRFNAFGECVFLPFDDCVRFIELRILSTLGEVDVVGLSEVMFAGRRKIAAVPEPTLAVLLATAGCVFLGRRRARRS